MNNRFLVTLSAGAAMLALLGAGCSANSPIATTPEKSSETAPAQSAQKEPSVAKPETAESAVAVAGSETPVKKEVIPAVAVGDAPVVYTYLGLNENKRSFKYSIKILSAKTVRQVNIDYQCFDATGQKTDDLTYAWENIVKSEQKPIVSGQTYEAKAPLLTEADRCVTKLKNVFFSDDTNWSA